jgi:hypothetical protein
MVGTDSWRPVLSAIFSGIPQDRDAYKVSFSAPIFSGDRQIFFEAATEVSDIEKIACIMQKMFFIQATMFLSNEKIILNMGTIFPIMEKIIGRLATIFCISQTKDLHTQIKVEGSKNIFFILPTIFLVNN